jgi:hypothetical protein
LIILIILGDFTYININGKICLCEFFC